MAAHTHYPTPALNALLLVLNALPPGEYLDTKELVWRACCPYASLMRHAKKPPLAAYRQVWGKGNPISWGSQSGAVLPPTEAE